MPTIDFYVISDAAPDAHLRYACRLAEQAVDAGQRVFIRATRTDDAKRIDDLLWAFDDHTFLPHEIATPASPNQSPSHPLVKILIGSQPPDNFRDLLINLSADTPIDIASLPRIAELVPADPERKRLAREHFKQYRERGVEPTTHNV
jgi:DNA polymerase-3 subunit chi